MTKNGWYTRVCTYQANTELPFQAISFFLTLEYIESASCGLVYSQFPLLFVFLFFFLILNLFIFNWKVIALQCCVHFCHTSTWISHRYTYVPSHLNLPPIWTSLPHSTRSHCSSFSQRTRLGSLCYTVTSHYLFQTWLCLSFNPSLSIVPALPVLTAPTNLFSMSASLFLPCK